MRVLKQNGLPYAGPVAIRQMYGLHIALQIAAIFTEQEAVFDRLPRNWTRDPRLTRV